MIKIDDNTTLYENEIEKALQDYADDRGITDLEEISQSKFHAALIHIYKTVFKGTDKLIENDHAGYKIDAVEQIKDIYIELCLENSKEISVEGFCRLIGCHKDTIYQWANNGDDRHRRIYTELHEGREESLSNKLSSSKSNCIGVIAILNRQFGWNSPLADTQAKPQNRLTRAEVLQIADDRPTEPIEMPGTSQLFTRKFRNEV